MGSAPHLVLGAGLAGLSASMVLRRRGLPHRVLEAASAVGGLARSTREAGYTFDCTGHLLHLRRADTRALVAELLGPESLLTIERRSVVYTKGVYVDYPFQANVGGLPPELAFACLRDFVAAHHVADPGTPGETFEAHCLRTFGRAMCDAFMVPYNTKVWGAHPRELSADWCHRFVPRPTLDEVLRGAVGLPNPGIGYNARFLYPRLGMGALAEALAERAGHVQLATRVATVDLDRRCVTADDGATFEFGALLSTLPLTELLDRVVGLPSEVREARAHLGSVPLFYLDLALNTPVELPFHWVYVPDAELPFYRVGAYSSFSAALAPAGKGSLYVELSTKARPELTTLLPDVVDALVAMKLLRAREAVRFARLRHVPHAYVRFDSARAQSVETARRFLQSRGVSSIGRYGSWTYASMEDALVEGQEAALSLDP
jgi:protoporphyrinogen oxidase